MDLLNLTAQMMFKGASVLAQSPCGPMDLDTMKLI